MWAISVFNQYAGRFGIYKEKSKHTHTQRQQIVVCITLKSIQLTIIICCNPFLGEKICVCHFKTVHVLTAMHRVWRATTNLKRKKIIISPQAHSDTFCTDSFVRKTKKNKQKYSSVIWNDWSHIELLASSCTWKIFETDLFWGNVNELAMHRI